MCRDDRDKKLLGTIDKHIVHHHELINDRMAVLEELKGQIGHYIDVRKFCLVNRLYAKERSLCVDLEPNIRGAE